MNGRSDTGASGLPGFVARELEAFLACGLLCRGFLRAVCEGCVEHVFIAFSCQTRGLCPSCCARRTEDITEHVVERILPDVGVRQWGLSLPFAHRARVAFDKELFGTLGRIFMEEVFRSYASRARATGIESPECGGILFLQRFGKKLNLNGHFHAVVLDGVYDAPTTPLASDRPDVEGSGRELEFHPASPPSPKVIEDVSARFATRIERLLGMRGAKADAGRCEAERPDALLHQIASSIRPVAMRLVDGRVEPVVAFGRGARLGEVGGYSVHAGAAVRAGDKDGRNVDLRGAKLEAPNDPPLARDFPGRTSRRASWAQLLRHVYDVGALECPACGGRLSVRAAIVDAHVVKRILEHDGLCDEPPSSKPRRADPAFDFP